MENPEGLIKIRKFIKVFYDVPAGLKQGSIFMVSQQTCCKISFFYSTILVFGKCLLFSFLCRNNIPQYCWKKKKKPKLILFGWILSLSFLKTLFWKLWNLFWFSFYYNLEKKFFSVENDKDVLSC